MVIHSKATFMIIQLSSNQSSVLQTRIKNKHQIIINCCLEIKTFGVDFKEINYRNLIPEHCLKDIQDNFSQIRLNAFLFHSDEYGTVNQCILYDSSNSMEISISLEPFEVGKFYKFIGHDKGSMPERDLYSIGVTRVECTSTIETNLLLCKYLKQIALIERLSWPDSKN
jgi:hypothetical protein